MQICSELHRSVHLSTRPREIAISACNFPASKLGKHFSFAGYLFATSRARWKVKKYPKELAKAGETPAVDSYKILHNI